ncbi:probable LRR receptor-like serine/threonine-protein kinase At1g53420 isoform X2 [Neltuma alba]|uniref:probable LRR receptor-like serine/threonine-protein kinase At1g53420 isoform X2 n=1 Tax=Neltuma alba TaxID=207710 RepID=UPI0010A4E5F7|nr:probable LRR receptor-like serine/threonine-protein kinase At1g53420 isoform X2 [Prosopis alba]
MNLILLPFFFARMALGSLVPEEVEALRDIGRTLGKKDWNFSGDPCSRGLSGWNVDCSVGNTGGHIISINLREGSLQGTLPPELVRLPYLQDLDLTRNYLSGIIPPEWGSMKLVKIILLANRLTGSIPAELANISTLEILNIGFNQFSGNLPTELGKLPRLQRLHLASNNFTGQIPATFAGLTNLTHFRISDNKFSGKIPDFIGNWKTLRMLAIVASGLSGPIPAGLSLLVNLVDLRISNLNGPDSNFPQLDNMTKLETIILRSCNIVGSLRLDFTESMSYLLVLDLSFNKLSGEMPSSFTRQSQVKFLYLSGNMLSGPVPDWSIRSENNVDLSYNNFSISNLKPSLCTQQNVNLFANPLGGNKSGLIPCSRVCPKAYYSFRINCGGKEVYVGGKKYDEDLIEGQASQLFVSERSNWAFSNTGHFIDDDQRLSKSYIADNDNNNSGLLFMPNSELYTNARLSPISLTYYGFCLENGNYTVNLHFAEIMFTADKSFRRLGRRVFDVYIQGKLVQKDFNIADAAGAGKAITRNHTVVVNKNDLEIRLYWAGKGTASVPDRAVYGPLISAISVDAGVSYCLINYIFLSITKFCDILCRRYTSSLMFMLPDFAIPSHSRGRLPLGVVIAIVVVGAIMIGLAMLCWIYFAKEKSTLDQTLDMRTGSFTLREIMAATNNFDDGNKIGEGGFGPVYKGFLSDGTVIAVKQLSSRSRQGNREFLNEIGMISALQNPHLVKLYGCCVEESQLLLIYEYMENNSLARALFGLENCWLELDWSTRKNICIGIAKGLAFLHEESRLKIIHRDIKATNVLLDKDLNPKISDFGLAKLYEEDNTHISTKIAGTRGYMAPEYAMHGYLTKKADVYSFGIVLLEIISGKTNTTQLSVEECFYLRDWAHHLKGGNLMDLVDPRLGEDFNREEIMVVIDVALQCTENSPRLRPIMSKVLNILEGRPFVGEVVSDDESEIMDGDLKLDWTKKEEADEDETQAVILSSHRSHTTYKSFSQTK